MTQNGHQYAVTHSLSLHLVKIFYMDNDFLTIKFDKKNFNFEVFFFK